MSLKLNKLKCDILYEIPEFVNDRQLAYIEDAVIKALREAYELGKKDSYSSWGHPGMSDQELRGIQGIYG